MDSKFKVGDKVIVRQWDDMEAEFGTNGWGEIDTSLTNFIEDMKIYCGKEVVISKLHADGDYYIEEDGGRWYWINEFFEPKEVKYNKISQFKELQDEELNIYELKNAKYGDSFGISVEKYGLISALTRMSDKWNRIENLILTNDDGTDDESLIDSLLDLSNYCKMTIIEIKNLNK